MKSLVIRNRVKVFYHDHRKMINLILATVFIIASCDKDAFRHLDNAGKFYKYGMYEQAVLELKNCSRLLKDDKNFQQSYYKDVLYAVIALKEGDQTSAIRHFELALKKKPTKIQLKFLVSTLYLQQKKYPEALKHFKTQDGLMVKYYITGIKKYYHKDYRQAANNFQKVLDSLENEYILFSQNRSDDLFAMDIIRASVSNLLGRSYLDLKEYQKAVNSFEKSLTYEYDMITELNLKISKLFIEIQTAKQNRYKIYASLGYHYAKLELYPEVIKYYTASLKSKKDYFPALVGMAEAYTSLGKYDKADKYYQTAIRDADEAKVRGDVYISFGNMYMAGGEILKAVSYFEKALLLIPDSVYAQQELSHVRLLKRVKQKPNNTQLNYQMARSFKKRKNYLSALLYIKRACRKSKQLSYQILEAEIYTNLKQYQKAEAIYRRILKQQSSYEEALVGLAAVLTVRKNYPAAISYLELAMEDNSSDIILRHKLAQAYFEAGLNSKAAQHWRYVRRNISNQQMIDFLDKVLEVIG